MEENEKLNTQMPQTSTENISVLLAPLQNLNLMDDYLFDAATVDLEACKIILELSLGIKIQRICWKEGQKVIHNLPGKRGIRMDFYVVDEDGRIFDVEMQKRNVGNIPKRTRFYQALLDAPLLESGEIGFDHLNPTYIVVICGFDIFGLKKYRYTFENLCHEALPQPLSLGDECKKVILNTKGENDDDVEQSLIDFLHYVEHSTDESIPDGCDERLRHLHEKVKHIKSSTQMGVDYMKMEERDRLLKEEGVEDGKECVNQLIQILIKQSRTDEIERAVTDKAYQDQLLKEFHLS